MRRSTTTILASLTVLLIATPNQIWEPKHQKSFHHILHSTVHSASQVPESNQNLLDHSWVVDSGASHFIGRFRSDFTSFRKITGKLQIADGNALPIEGRGEVTIRVRHNGRWYHLQLSDVLYVPTCGRTCSPLDKPLNVMSNSTSTQSPVS